jgi:hypothetical protein
MLIKDEAKLKNHIKQAKAEQARQQAMAYAANIYKNGLVMLDPDTNPTLIDRQMGQKLTTEELEKKLKKVNERFFFEHILLPDGTTHKTCKRLVVRMPHGKETVCVYSIGAVPEFSVHKVCEEVVVDMTMKAVHRNDLPKHSVGNLEVETDPNSPDYGNTRGEAYKFHGDIPGVKKIKVPGGELIRGWRTVLARIVGEGYATPTKVEQVFGSSDRLAWAAQMGKTSTFAPY